MKQAAKSPSVPTVKSQLPADEWGKRGNSDIYRKRVKRMVHLLKTCERQGKKATAEQAHYWLDANQPEDVRRLRSPGERLDNDSLPKDSVRY